MKINEYLICKKPMFNSFIVSKKYKITFISYYNINIQSDDFEDFHFDLKFEINDRYIWKYFYTQKELRIKKLETLK